MREIKFRAWLGGVIHPVWTRIDEDVYKTHPDIKIMQFTGLKAKNGLVYESDIVRETREYYVVEEGNNVSEPIIKRVVNKKSFDSYYSSKIDQFSITWTGVIKITPIRGVFISNAVVEGSMFDEKDGILRPIRKRVHDELGDYDTDENFVKRVHKPKSNSELEIIGNIYENPELLK